ncbi:hypothetical protein Fmac_011911 [Flemingia macrophylla]|uniref:Uncharacterized protein n=1 Tax=Flemingia macrophylla TaxID=520843 RepID=A0ABD1MNT3_9FABA
MASMASSSSFCNPRFLTKPNNATASLPRIRFCQNHHNDSQINRRELILRSSEIATIGAIVNFSGKKPDYLGVQENPPALAVNYNPEGRKNPVSKEEAMEELIDVFVDDVEFWFRPGKGSTVEYRSASRLGNFDFDVNRKIIKALRQELEKKGWASQDTI